MTGVFELKLCKGTRFAFKSLQDHQETALLNASSDIGCSHKLSDMSLDQKPFDCFRIKNYPAYVVICFYVPRKKKRLYYIGIDEYVRRRDEILKTTGMKSFTEDEVSEIAYDWLDI